MKLKRNIRADRDLISMAHNIVLFFSEMGNTQYENIADVVDNLITEVEHLEEALHAPLPEEVIETIASIRSLGKHAEIQEAAGLIERLARENCRLRLDRVCSDIPNNWAYEPNIPTPRISMRMETPYGPD